MPHLRIAVIGAHAAALYTADLLMRCHCPIAIDVFDSSPAPLGLGVSPTSPTSTTNVRSTVRIIGNVHVDVDTLAPFYDAVIDANFTDDATAQYTVATTVSRVQGANKHPRREITAYFEQLQLPFTVWLNALRLPTDRTLDDWKRAQQLAREIPVCV